MVGVSAPDARLVDAVRALLAKASSPVALGERQDQGEYVLVPAYAIENLTEALTPDQSTPMPHVWASPDMKGGTPVINGRRLGAEDMADRYWHFGDVYQFEILDSYELTRSELLIACWYTATYGSRTYRRRWNDWAQSIWAQTGMVEKPSGWWGPLDDVPLPPHKHTEAPLPQAGGSL